MNNNKGLSMIQKRTGNAERGIALFFTMFALLLLMAIAGALTFTATIETSVNANYRQEQLAYFAAKAGIEEARARMMQTDPAPITAALPTVVPTATNSAVIYIVNPGAGSSTSVQPWSTTSSTYPDDELCHDGYTGLFSTTTTVFAPGVPCSSSGAAVLPTGSSWYSHFTSTLPYSGTASALPYKWVRIAPKLNSSVSYLDVTSSPATIKYYTNNTSSTYAAATLTCWNDAREVPLVIGDTNCGQMLNSAGSPMTPVYLLTSLGVSPMGARKMVQAEVALTPTPPFIYGMYGTSTACPAITFTGQSPSTNSYTSANGQTYSQTISSTGGDIGSNGSVSVQNGNIGGVVGVTSTACPNPVTINSPGGSMLGSVACPSGDTSNAPTSCYLPAPYVFSVPPLPINVTNTNTSPSTCTTVTTVTNGHHTTTTTTAYNCMVPGTYGNISIQNSLTLAPGTYNINSISMTGNAQIIVSPPGAVTLNVAGIGQSNPIAIGGNGIVDDTVANDFVINYGCTPATSCGSVSIAGNGNVTAILNAPNAAITQQGNGNWYGSIVGSTISIGGNAFFHYDRNSTLAPANNGYYSLISYREIGY
jgi:Tfp pilus assembly protein PilX